MVDKTGIDSVCSHLGVLSIERDIPVGLKLVVFICRFGFYLGEPWWDFVNKVCVLQDLEEQDLQGVIVPFQVLVLSQGGTSS